LRQKFQFYATVASSFYFFTSSELHPISGWARCPPAPSGFLALGALGSATTIVAALAAAWLMFFPEGGESALKLDDNRSLHA
jgi:hypothetical protein